MASSACFWEIKASVSITDCAEVKWKLTASQLNIWKRERAGAIGAEWKRQKHDVNSTFMLHISTQVLLKRTLVCVCFCVWEHKQAASPSKCVVAFSYFSVIRGILYYIKLSKSLTHVSHPYFLKLNLKLKWIRWCMRTSPMNSSSMSVYPVVWNLKII